MGTDRADRAGDDARNLGWLLALAAALSAYRVWLLDHLAIDLFVDEAQYWLWSRDLQWGYYSKPPVIAALIRAGTTIVGDTPLGVRAPSLLLHPAAVFAAYAIGRCWFEPRAAFWGALAVATLPLAAIYALFASTDWPLVLCWLLASLLLVRAISADRWRDWLALGAAVGIGLLSKYTMAAFALSALAAVLLIPGARAQLASVRPWTAVALALAVFSPNFLWNAANSFPTWQHVAEITQHAGRGSPLRDLGEFVAAQWAAAGPVFGTIALVLLFPLVARRAFADERLRWLACLAYPLLAIGCVQAWRGGANANWAAPGVIVGGLLAAAWLASTNRWRWLAAGVAINALLAVTALHWPDLLRAAGVESTRRLDPFVRVRGWSQLADGIASIQRQHPQAVVVGADRELLSQIAFYVRPARLAAWPPSGAPGSHYELAMPLPREYRGDVLLVGRGADVDDYARRFVSTQPLGIVRVRVHADFERVVHIHLLREYRGPP